MANYTRQDLEQIYPFETTTIQVGNVTRPMTREEWDEWIESRIGDEIWEPLT